MKKIKNDSLKLPLHTNIRRVIIIASLILVLGFGSFLTWALVAPLDEGVVAPGVVTVISNRKTIQHMHGGIVKEILVSEGDKVKANQVLVRLDDAEPRANLTAVRSEYLVALAVEARLLAERIGAGRIAFPAELFLHKDNPDISEFMRRQIELFQARRRALENEKNILKESIEGLQEYIVGLEELQKYQLKQVDLLTREVEQLRELADEGYYPRNKIIEMESTIADLTGKRSEELGNIARARKSVSEYKMRVLLTEQEFLREVEAELSDIKKKLSALKDQYAAVQDVVERTEIRSPVDGIVLGLNIHTIGGVITVGQRIMDIVPIDSELIVEAKVNPQDVDKVHNGLEADLRFTSFSLKKTHVVEGNVILVSADRMVDEQTGIPYYLCKVRPRTKDLDALIAKAGEIQPGMPVQVIIKTGERTFMNYLIRPLIDRLAASLKEE